MYLGTNRRVAAAGPSEQLQPHPTACALPRMGPRWFHSLPRTFASVLRTMAAREGIFHRLGTTSEVRALSPEANTKARTCHRALQWAKDFARTSHWFTATITALRAKIHIQLKRHQVALTRHRRSALQSAMQQQQPLITTTLLINGASRGAHSPLRVSKVSCKLS